MENNSQLVEQKKMTFKDRVRNALQNLTKRFRSITGLSKKEKKEIKDKVSDLNKEIDKDAEYNSKDDAEKIRNYRNSKLFDELAGEDASLYKEDVESKLKRETRERENSYRGRLFNAEKDNIKNYKAGKRKKRGGKKTKKKGRY